MWQKKQSLDLIKSDFWDNNTNNYLDQEVILQPKRFEVIMP